MWRRAGFIGSIIANDADLQYSLPTNSHVSTSFTNFATTAIAKVFVTGGTGFIGQHLINALIKKGDDVTALIKNKDLINVVESMGASVITNDIRNIKSLKLPPFDYTFHIAGSIHHTKGYEALYETNVTGTKI